jgi:hypothetical protein
MKNYAKLVASLISAWFVIVLVAAAQHAFLNPQNRIGLAVAFAASAPIVIFLLWLAASPDFRRFTLSLNPVILTFLQSWRIVGAVFVVLGIYGGLPQLFARPAGYGDMFIGATAPLAALWLMAQRHRAASIGWQLLGILDLVTAVAVGTTAGFVNPSGTPMVAMTVLPLSLVPTFFVPLFVIIHLICIRQALSWEPASAVALNAAASHN